MNAPKGYVALVLHAHLPFVRHPEYEYFMEEDWLYEAITETYIPLLDMLEGLTRDGVPYKLTMSLTPPLISMLKDPLLQSRYLRELNKLIELAEKEVARTKNEHELLHESAKMYLKRFMHSRYVFEEKYGRDLVAAFDSFAQTGDLEIITCGATHGFLPLLSVHEPSVRAQLNVAKDHYQETFGRPPKGIWLPECAYYPGVDEKLADIDIRYFFTDTHGVAYATPRPVYGVYAPVYTPHGVAVVARDPESSKQVWSANEGYPGDPDYREFYRDVGYDREYDYIRPYLPPTGERKNLGLKYYRITGNVPLSAKEPYNPHAATEKAAIHAGNFMFNRERQIEWLYSRMGRPALVVSPYDAELFGHWWFEGPQFLNFFIRKAAYDQNVFRLTHVWEYLNNYPEAQVVEPAASSWGHNGAYEVWLEGSNEWIWKPILAASMKMTELADRFPQLPQDQLLHRALKQAAREILLAQSSDWPFIMKTNTVVQYAQKRIKIHIARFMRLYGQILSGNIDAKWLESVESRDNIFPNINYRHFASKNN